jgi:hypothetical protein
MRYLSIGLPLTLAVGLITPSISRAQELTALPTATCADTTAGSYDSCALFLDGRRLKQGVQGAVVATPGFWRPLPLTAAVGGDSALFYARRFERYAFRADATRLATGLLMVGGLFVTRPCRFNSTCGSRFVTGGSMILSGSVLALVSSTLQHHAESDAARAVWFHNSRYGRP